MSGIKSLKATLPVVSREIFFGPFPVTQYVFYLTAHSFAIVNLKPLLPGHVLVSPIRRIPRLLDLGSTEYSDFWNTVRKVSKMMERVFKADSLNIAVQDGPVAGQSVPHVHCHIIPRQIKDLEHRGGNDALYEMLNNDEGDIASNWVQFTKIRESGAKDFKDVGDEREPRTVEDMMAEAQMLTWEMKADEDRESSL